MTSCLPALCADTLFAADLTIMEEGSELLHRLTEQRSTNSDEKKPMFTSCCPGWVGMVEKMYPDIIPYLSSCKSPQMMMGAVIKNFFAQEIGAKPADIMSCSIMPCTRKQEEADRPWQETDGCRDVDHVITTVELAAMLKERGIDLTVSDNSCLLFEPAGSCFVCITPRPLADGLC